MKPLHQLGLAIIRSGAGQHGQPYSIDIDVGELALSNLVRSYLLAPDLICGVLLEEQRRLGPLQVRQVVEVTIVAPICDGDQWGIFSLRLEIDLRLVMTSSCIVVS